MNEIVKYDNYLNELNLKGFTSTDLDFLFALCAKMKNKKTERIEFTFSELKNVTDHKINCKERFISELERMNKKLMKVNCKQKTDNEIVMFNLFHAFEIDQQDHILKISVDERFEFILNNLVKNFTRFELLEFINLKSKYSKNLYRNLKQYRTTGLLKIPIEELREKLDCPKSYSNKEFNRTILQPVVEELRVCFPNLKMNPSKAETRGRAVKGYIFTFDPESKTPTASSSAEPKPKTPLLTKDGFDLDFAWKETIKIYPRQSNINSAHKTWLKIVQAEEGQEKATCTAIFNAIQRYKADYIEKNQDDTEFKFVPAFGKWLKNELDNYR